MRVSDRMIFANATRHAGDARARVEKAAAETATGVRVRHPGDDPAAMGQLVAGTAALARYESIRQAADGAHDELVQADAALGSVATMVRRAEQLAVQLANDTYDARARAAAASEVEALIEGITAALNTSHGGRHLFGGTNASVPPFETDGTFHGDGGARLVEIAPGVFEDVAPSAVAITGSGGSPSLHAVLSGLATALAGNDVAGIRAAIQDVGEVGSRIAGERARLGGSMQVLETASAVALEGRDAAKGLVARLTEADVVEAASELALSQRALEAALSAAAQSFRLTLLDEL